MVLGLNMPAHVIFVQRKTSEHEKETCDSLMFTLNKLFLKVEIKEMFLWIPAWIECLGISNMYVLNGLKSKHANPSKWVRFDELLKL